MNPMQISRPTEFQPRRRHPIVRRRSITGTDQQQVVVRVVERRESRDPRLVVKTMREVRELARLDLEAILFEEVADGGSKVGEVPDR